LEKLACGRFSDIGFVAGRKGATFAACALGQVHFFPCVTLSSCIVLGA
jgi:hypothetical protein